MKEEEQRARRPGGRSARVRAAVHQAVTDLVNESGYGNFSVGDIAARAGVADTSIYRRWGGLDALLTDVARTAQSAIPDTGSLDGDLRAYAANVARDITGPAGPAVLRLGIALSAAGPDGALLRDEFMDERYRQLQAMLDLSRERGERPPEVMEVIDHILAPLYFRVAFGQERIDPAYTEGLVERLLESLTGTARSQGSGADARRPHTE